MRLLHKPKRVRTHGRRSRTRASVATQAVWAGGRRGSGTGALRCCLCLSAAIANESTSASQGQPIVGPIPSGWTDSDGLGKYLIDSDGIRTDLDRLEQTRAGQFSDSCILR